MVDKQNMPYGGKYTFLPDDQQPQVLDGSTTPAENLSGGGVGEFASDLARTAGELPGRIADTGKELWDRSWAGAAIRHVVPRLAYGWDTYDKYERATRVEDYRKEYDVSREEAKDYAMYGIKPPKVAEGEALAKQREEEYIASKGGMLSAMGDYIVDQPGEFAKELAMGIAADPELLLLGGVFKGVFQGMMKAGAGAKTAAVGATAVESGIGAGVGAAGMAMESREKTGEVDPAQVKMGAQLGAGAGLLAAGVSVRGALKRAGDIVEASTGLQSKEIQAAIVQYAKDYKVGMQIAAQKVMSAHGVDPGAIINEIDTVAARLAKEASEADPNFARQQAMTMEQARNPKPAQPAEAVGGKQGMGPHKQVDEAERVRKQELAGAKAESEMKANDIQTRLQGAVERIAGKEHMSANNDTAAHISLIERIAWKERQVAHGSSRDVSSSESMLDYPAYRPEPGALQKPILTHKEFQETALGKSSGGKTLTGAALYKRYDKWTREMQADYRDSKQVVTASELEAIMSEKSPAMQNFFATQARVKGSRAKPTTKLKFKGKQGGGGGQAGNVNPKLLGLMGGMGLAALIGYSEKHDPVDALKYLLGVGATLAIGGKFIRKFSKLHPVSSHIVQARKGTTLGSIFNDWQGQGAVYDRKLMQVRSSMRILSGQADEGGKGLVVNKEALKLREAVTDALEDKTGKQYKALPDNGKEMYKIAEDYFKNWGERGKAMGILEDIIENYVPHAYKHDKLLGEGAVKDAFFGTQTRQQSMDTVHRKTRVIPTYKVAEAAVGLTPRTKDIAELMTMYGKSADLAMRSTQLMSTLRHTLSPDHNTNMLVMSMKKAPKNYVTISHPKFNGWKVHPDIAAATKSMFSANDTGALKRGALWTSFFIKRNNVALSAFHMKALMMSYVMANGMSSMIKHPIRSTADIINTFRGKSKALQSLKSTVHDDTSKAIDEGIKNGLMIQAVDDVGRDTFYEGLDTVSQVLDKFVPQKYGAAIANTFGLPAKVAQKTLSGYAKANKIVDAVMWDRVYTGMKIQTYMNKMATLSARYGDTNPRAELAAQAAEFTNDAFGGLNWSRIAEGVDNKLGNQIAHQLTSPGSRKNMQLAAFAPDWTTANVRVFYKAFANKKPMQQVMYMHYQLRGLMMSAMVGEAMTYHFTGRHLWEMNDMTKIHMGDGTHFTFSKQFMEPMHWLTKPMQSAMGKMGVLPSTAISGALGQQYLRAGGTAPPISEIGYGAWAGKKTMPIWMQQEGLKRKAQSLAGFPVYGSPKKGGGLRTLKRSRSRSKSRAGNR